MRTLADLIEEHGPLPVRDAIGWTLRASLTLWALHEEGILHGRVSPAAILVEDTVCRSDALLIRPSQLEDAPAYQSLGRAQGDPPSKGDDVWAVGLTLYYVLTGEMPYPDGVAAAVQKGKVKAPPPLAVHGAALDVMQPVLDRLIRADRPDRIRVAEEIVAGLRDLSPAIADVDPLAIEQAFDESDIIGGKPKAPRSEPPLSVRDQEAWRKLTVNSLAPPAEAADQTRTLLIAFVAALVLGVIVFLVVSPGSDTTAPPAPTVAQPVPAPVPPPVEPTTPVPAAPPPSVTAAPAPAAPRSVERDSDFVACTSNLFAADAFKAKKVTTDFPCGEKNPAKGVQKVTSLLARGSGGQATKAAKEWSNLGWYQAAIFAVARGQCCNSPPPLVSSRLIEVCELDPVLMSLTKSTASGTDDEVAIALKKFGSAANCVATAGGGPMFHQPRMPNPQQAVLFLKMMGRMRTAK